VPSDRAERKTVWFSCREDWEPTATKGLRRGNDEAIATMAEMLAHGGSLVRLEVPPAIARHTWAKHVRLAHLDPEITDALVAVARDVDADPGIMAKASRAEGHPTSPFGAVLRRLDPENPRSGNVVVADSPLLTSSSKA
jgi:hypothetical protein